MLMADASHFEINMQIMSDVLCSDDGSIMGKRRKPGST
jgi:hypothetical protein